MRIASGLAGKLSPRRNWAGRKRKWWWFDCDVDDENKGRGRQGNGKQSNGLTYIWRNKHEKTWRAWAGRRRARNADVVGEHERAVCHILVVEKDMPSASRYRCQSCAERKEYLHWWYKLMGMGVSPQSACRYLLFVILAISTAQLQQQVNASKV